MPHHVDCTITFASPAEIFLSLSTVGIGICDVLRWLLVPSPPTPASFGSFAFSCSIVARFAVSFTQVEFVVITALRFFNCVFSSVENTFELDANLMMHDGILIYFRPSVVAGTVNLGLLSIVPGTQIEAVMSKIAFERVKDLN